MKVSQAVRLLNSNMAVKCTDVASCPWGTQREGGQAGWGWVSKEADALAGAIDNNTNLGAVTTLNDIAAYRLMPLLVSYVKDTLCMRPNDTQTRMTVRLRSDSLDTDRL